MKSMFEFHLPAAFCFSISGFIKENDMSLGRCFLLFLKLSLLFSLCDANACFRTPGEPESDMYYDVEPEDCQYERYWYTKHDRQCQCCPKCGHGTGILMDCNQGVGPDKLWNLATGYKKTCEPCRRGTYSDSYGFETKCIPCTSCNELNRHTLIQGCTESGISHDHLNTNDSQCGSCLPHHYSVWRDGNDTETDTCFPCAELLDPAKKKHRTDQIDGQCNYFIERDQLATRNGWITASCVAVFALLAIGLLLICCRFCKPGKEKAFTLPACLTRGAILCQTWDMYTISRRRRAESKNCSKGNYEEAPVDSDKNVLPSHKITLSSEVNS